MASVPVIGVDVTDLKKLAKTLKASGDLEGSAALKSALREGADIVAAAWKQRISPYSTRIPATIKAKSNAKAAWVTAGGKKAPHAAAFENNGKSGKFRHPVFGNRKVWVDQPAHPTAIDALEASLDQVAEKVEDSIDKWLETAFADK